MDLKITTDDFHKRCRQLQWVLLDVDGVLTDGRLFSDSQGEAGLAFHIHDGMGIRMLRDAGLKVGILSARLSTPAKRRAQQLAMDAIIQGEDDKARAFDVFLRTHDTRENEIAYAGDDILDLNVLIRAGLAMAPQNAVEHVKSNVHLVTERRGGLGAVREMAESILSARNQLDMVIRRLRSMET